MKNNRKLNSNGSGIDHRMAFDPSPLGSTLGQRLVWALEASALGCFWFIARVLPIGQASRLGGWFLRRLGPRLHRHRIICGNLAVAHQARSSSAIDVLARGIWASFGQVMAEFAHLSEICGQQLDDRVELIIDSSTGISVQPTKPVVFVGAHLANWEIGAAAVARRGTPLTVVFTPHKNPIIARMVQKKRQALGCGFVSKNASLRLLVRQLQEGRSIGFVVDRRFDQGAQMPFFGVEALIALAPARLAQKFGCQLVPVRVERTGLARYRVTAFPPIEPDELIKDDRNRAKDMMRQAFEQFESWIEDRPDEWFCSKRIWPRSPPSPEKRGYADRPAPAPTIQHDDLEQERILSSS